MTCCVVMFMLITTALLLVTCLTSTTILQKLRTELIAIGVYQDGSTSVHPGSLPTTGSTPAAASWTPGCHPPSEVMLPLHRCPTGSRTAAAVLNWLVFPAAWAMCWLFCVSPTYLGWRLSWLLLIPTFDRGTLGQ